MVLDSSLLKPHASNLTFSKKYLQDYETKVRNDNLNARRRKTIDREDVILRPVYQFDDLTFMEQSDINTNVNYAFKLGSVNPNIELVKTSDFFVPSATV